MNLARRSALLIGAGGLGAPAAVSLAAAGVGHLTLLDDDRVDPTNLSRQMLFGCERHRRVEGDRSCAAALRQRFPSVGVGAVTGRFGSSTLSRDLLGHHDIVIDGSDNFATRFAVNDECVAARVPFVHGAAIRWQGQVMTVLPGQSPCLRCVFEDEPPPGIAPTCGDAGVMGPLARE